MWTMGLEVVVAWGLANIYKRSGHIRDGSNMRVNYSGFRIFSLIRLLRHQTSIPCKVCELHRHQNIFLDKTATTIFLCKVHSLLPDSTTIDQ